MQCNIQYVSIWNEIIFDSIQRSVFDNSKPKIKAERTPLSLTMRKTLVIVHRIDNCVHVYDELISIGEACAEAIH